MSSAPYRALVKQAMRPRQERILFLATLTAYTLLCASILSPRALFSHGVAIGTALWVVLIVLPMLLRRRTALIFHAPRHFKPGYTSRGAHCVSLLRSTYVWREMSLHAAFAVASAVCIAATATHTFGWDAALAPMHFVASHGTYYIQESFLVFLLHAAFIGAVFAFCEAARTPAGCRNLPPFDPAVVMHGGVSLRVRFFGVLAQRISRTFLLPLSTLLPFALYVLCRDAFWERVLQLVGIESILRRFVVPSFRTPFHPMLVFVRVLLPVAAILALFVTTYTLFDVYWSHPLPILSDRARDPNAALLAGLNDTQPFFAAHAFSELARIALYDPKRRKIIFDDVQRQHGRPVAWTGIYLACTHALDNFLKGETKRVPLQPKRDAPSSQPATIWQALAQPPAKAPEQLRNALPLAAPTQTGVSLVQIVHMTLCIAGAVAKRMWSMVPSDAKHALVPQALALFFAAPSPALELNDRLMAQRAFVAWSAIALNHLAQASITEDRYGCVQNDLGGMVQSLVGAHERLLGVQRHIELTALDADNQLVREARVVRNALEQAGDAATFSTAYAPCYNELQSTWQASYATLDTMLSGSARQILHTFAPFGVESVDRR
ncbi:hypothetical protein MVES1_002825 [Malassezia vespertilionis]|uniref:Ndc1p n=1 Tax=Malassezia vespertilionis TaxID=2020962 RepID=A0A2N1JAL8_9BASI|nr:uncharacterized protein MVES1_002825 [Malassezia vespertilionis]PKI83600.1 hypothetical protein MVES_002670 [Malassezia vespertilionis]WFD07459.1 hypothetical protein MVES1_002825 [Malassezia vespertilionis]